MSEVKRFRADHRHVVETKFDDAQFVGVVDFDRVTGERDALQQRLTAADERVDVLEGLLRNLPEDLKDLSGSENTAGVYACIDYIEQCVAALKPAEAPRNQCDGCQAGIPLINGTHRMGLEGGYPDFMGCSAKLYKPADGGGDA